MSIPRKRPHVKKTFDEKTLRESPNPHPQTPRALAAYIQNLAQPDAHDYGTCVYAMSLSAVAAYNFVAHRLGVTGFQASCADLDILTRTRGFKGPFAIINGEDMLYPQYDIPKKVREYMTSWSEWAQVEAQKLLDEHKDNKLVDSHVRAHWQKLAEGKK
jgi:hypothetical protein